VHTDIKNRAVEQGRELLTSRFASPQEVAELRYGEPISETWGENNE